MSYERCSYFADIVANFFVRCAAPIARRGRPKAGAQPRAFTRAPPAAEPHGVRRPPLTARARTRARLSQVSTCAGAKGSSGSPVWTIDAGSGRRTVGALLNGGFEDGPTTGALGGGVFQPRCRRLFGGGGGGQESRRHPPAAPPAKPPHAPPPKPSPHVAGVRFTPELTALMWGWVGETPC